MISILATDTEAAFDKLLEAHVDITNPEHVGVLIDRNRGVIWVNVNGVCVVRCCAINMLTVEEVQ